MEPIRWADLPEAVQNTCEIARRCNYVMELGEYYLPRFETPGAYSVEDFLAVQAAEGLQGKFEQYPELANLAEDHGVVVAVNQNGRWAPYFSYMRQAIDAGWIGSCMREPTGTTSRNSRTKRTAAATCYWIKANRWDLAQLSTPRSNTRERWYPRSLTS